MPTHVDVRVQMVNFGSHEIPRNILAMRAHVLSFTTILSQKKYHFPNKSNTPYYENNLTVHVLNLSGPFHSKHIHFPVVTKNGIGQTGTKSPIGACQPCQDTHTTKFEGQYFEILWRLG